MEYAPSAETIAKDYRSITTTAELEELVAELRAAGRFGIRVLSDGSAAVCASIVGLAFATGDRIARYVPLGHQAPTSRSRGKKEAPVPHPEMASGDLLAPSPLSADPGAAALRSSLDSSRCSTPCDPCWKMPRSRRSATI